MTLLGCEFTAYGTPIGVVGGWACAPIVPLPPCSYAYAKPRTIHFSMTVKMLCFMFISDGRQCSRHGLVCLLPMVLCLSRHYLHVQASLEEIHAIPVK